MLSISNLWPLFLKSQDFNGLSSFQISILNQKQDFSQISDSGHFISWGEGVKDIKHSLLECGFFEDAIHIDKYGLYDKASFNFPFAKKIIDDYIAPKSFLQFKEEGKIKSKFGQPTSNCQWDGIVLACQYPRDRSIVSVGSTKDYYNFLEDACKFYGQRLFLKKHPVMVWDAKENEIINFLCSKYKCEQGQVGESILEKAESVLVYNSTYVVDAIQHDIPVMQYAPGYFWQTGVVDFLSGKLSSTPEICDFRWKNQFLDFLVWKYCFSSLLPLESIVSILKAFKESKDFFPLPEELSYGRFIEDQ